MRKYECPVCGIATNHPMKDALWHFRLIDFEFVREASHAVKTGGLDATLLGGINNALCLMSPAYNTIRYWKYRKCFLNFGDTILPEKGTKP